MGLAVARLLRERGWEVFAGTYGEASAAAVRAEGFEAFSCDLSDSASMDRVPVLAGCEAVVHCASSGRGGAEAYERVYYQGARNLAERAAGAHLVSRAALRCTRRRTADGSRRKVPRNQTGIRGAVCGPRRIS